MRLLRVEDDLALHFEEFLASNIPKYAILSHTWDNEAVSYKDFMKDRGTKKSYEKIRGCARQSLRDDLRYIWVDTCCIDKRSSAELTEAINSMYAWYRDSEQCYAYLADVPAKPWETSRWTTRGWTLQELIAPRTVDFFDSSWRHFGSKLTLRTGLSEITGIQSDVLDGTCNLRRVPAAMKMCWASKRRTTRPEDEAYCLLGLFDVNMPLLYGEGSKAFQRLQEAIAHRTSDSSLLAWRAESVESAGTPYASALSPSAQCFAHLRIYKEFKRDSKDTLDLRKHEVRFSAFLRPLKEKKYVYEAWLGLQVTGIPRSRLKLGILLLNIGELNGETTSPPQYVRVQPHYLSTLNTYRFELDREHSRESGSSKDDAPIMVSLINSSEPSRILIQCTPSLDVRMLFGRHQPTEDWYRLSLDHSFDDGKVVDTGFSNYAFVWEEPQTVLFLRLDLFGRPHVRLWPFEHFISLAIGTQNGRYIAVGTCLKMPEFTKAMTNLYDHLQRDLQHHREYDLNATAQIVFSHGELQVAINIIREWESSWGNNNEEESFS